MSRVLVAAPTARLRAGLAGELSAASFEVAEVVEADEIATRLVAHPTAALLVAVGRDGVTSATVAELADRNLLPPVVVALSPADDPEVVADALAAGATAYLPVTAPADRIVAEVRRAVARTEPVAAAPVLDVRSAPEPSEGP